jgi:hypothetical protein
VDRLSRVPGLLWGAVAGVVVSGALVITAPAIPNRPEVPPNLPACVTEDGPAPCVWDSVTQGNGTSGAGTERYVLVLR